MRKSLTILASAAQTEEGKNMNLGILGGGGKKSKRSAFLASLAAILLAAFGGVASAQTTEVGIGTVTGSAANPGTAALGEDEKNLAANASASAGVYLTADGGVVQGYYSKSASAWQSALPLISDLGLYPTGDGGTSGVFPDVPHYWGVNLSSLNLSNLVFNNGNTTSNDIASGAVVLNAANATGTLAATYANTTYTIGNIGVTAAANAQNSNSISGLLFVGTPVNAINNPYQSSTYHFAGTATIGDVTVTDLRPAAATSNAFGLNFGGADEPAAKNVTDGVSSVFGSTIKVGTIKVTSAFNNATGIAFDGGTFTVDHDITATVGRLDVTGILGGSGAGQVAAAVNLGTGLNTNANGGAAERVTLRSSTLVLTNGAKLVAKRLESATAAHNLATQLYSLVGSGTLVLQDKLFTNGGENFNWGQNAGQAWLTFNGDADLNKTFKNDVINTNAPNTGRIVQTIQGNGNPVGVLIEAGVRDAAGNWTPNTNAKIDLGWTDLSGTSNVQLWAAGDTVIRTHGDVYGTQSPAGTATAGTTLNVFGDYAAPAVPPAGWTQPANTNGGRVELAGNVWATTTNVGSPSAANGATDSVTLAVSGRDILAADGYNHNPQYRVGQDVSVPVASSGITSNGSLGQLIVNNGATLEVWGNVDSKVNGTSYNRAITTGVTLNGTGKIVNMAGLTDWKVVGGNLVANGVLAQANVDDGFLAALAVHGRYTAWNAVRDRFISGTRSGRFLGQAPCDPCAPCGVSECDPCEPVCETDCNPCDPCATGHHGLFGKGGHYVGKNVGRAFWVNYVGRADSYQSSYTYGGTRVGSKWKIGTDGVQVGADLYNSGRSQFGVLFGYEGGWARNEVPNYQTDTVNTDDTYVGFYAARVLRNGADVRATVNVGWQNHDTLRYDPRWNELRPYRASFDGNTVEANFELGKRLHNGAWSVRPVVAVDVAYNHLDSVQEDLFGWSSDALRYGGIDRTEVLLRFGSDLRFQRNRFTFNSGLYYSYDVNGQRAKTSVTADVIEGTAGSSLISSTLYGSDFGRSVITFNVGGEYAFRCLTVFGGFQGQGVTDRDGDGFQSVGYVGGAWHW